MYGFTAIEYPVLNSPVRYGVDEYVDIVSCALKDQMHPADSASQIIEPVTMEEA